MRKGIVYRAGVVTLTLVAMSGCTPGPSSSSRGSASNPTAALGATVVCAQPRPARAVRTHVKQVVSDAVLLQLLGNGEATIAPIPWGVTTFTSAFFPSGVATAEEIVAQLPGAHITEPSPALDVSTWRDVAQDVHLPGDRIWYLVVDRVEAQIELACLPGQRLRRVKVITWESPVQGLLDCESESRGTSAAARAVEFYCQDGLWEVNYPESDAFFPAP